MQAAVKLRGVLPVVVDADLWEDAGEALDDIFIPDAEIWYSRTPSCMVMVVPHADICTRIVHIPAAWAVSVCMPCLSDDGRQHALVEQRFGVGLAYGQSLQPACQGACLEYCL